MAKKKQHIKVITNADKDTLSGLYRIGGLTQDHIKGLGTSGDRLKQHIKQGYIVKDTEHFDRATKSSTTIYRLTDVGKRKCREICDVGSSYKSTAIRHDLALADKYVNLHKQGLTDKWYTEQDWRNRLEEEIDRLRTKGRINEADRIQEAWKNKEISVPDGGYVGADGGLVVVEIVTRYYTEQQIEAKQQFVSTMGVKYEEIDIN